MQKIRALLVALGIAVAMLIAPAAPAHAAYDEIKARGTRDYILMSNNNYEVRMKLKVQFGFDYTGDVNDDEPVAVRSWVQIKCYEKTGSGLEPHGCWKRLDLILWRKDVDRGPVRIHQVHHQAAHQWEVTWQGAWQGYYPYSDWHQTLVDALCFGIGNYSDCRSIYSSYQAVP